MFHVKQQNTMTQNQCLICGNKSLKTKLELKDYFLSNEKFELLECPDCGFIMTSPRPKPDELGRYYESDDYLSHNTESKSLITGIYSFARNLAINKKYKLIRALSDKKKLLDIGSGTGEFLAFMQSQGYDVCGIEPSEKAREFARKNNKLELQTEDSIPKLADGSFDVITMWHVLEHVYQLNERMESLQRLLKNDGTLILALPNHESNDAAYYGKYWAAWDVPRHLYHFNRKSIERLLEKHNFKLHAIKPMNMDSYYVSMLSEEIKSGKKNLIKASIRGLVSNLKAMKTNEYSSLIYIARKV